MCLKNDLFNKPFYLYSVLLVLLLFIGTNSGCTTKSSVVAERQASTKNTEIEYFADLLTMERGDIPIIISAPHGGDVRIPGSKIRKDGIIVKDLHTAEIALLLYQGLTARLHAEPYLIIAQFSRKFVDTNRRATNAYENKIAEVYYEEYHESLESAVIQAIDRFGYAVVIDLHGQAHKPEAIYRGTRNGATVDDLIKKHGLEAVNGYKSIMGQLHSMGYNIYPTLDDEEIGYEDRYTGGYITHYYGSKIENADAIQIELGRDYRNNIVKMSQDLAKSIAIFYKEFVEDSFQIN